MTSLTTETIIEMLKEVLDLLALPQNIKKVAEAQERSENELVKLMKHVFPIVMKIQTSVLKRHGLGEGKDCLLEFNQLLRTVESESAEIARLRSLIRAHYVPLTSVITTANSALQMDRTSSRHHLLP